MKNFENLWNEELKKENPSLLRVLFKTHILKIILVGVLFSVIEIPCK
jgi:hypothetical protein